MDLVRLFFDDTDIEPTVLLKHFLHFLGFYVDKNRQYKSENDIGSLVDIYIVSDSLVKESNFLFENIDKEKSILILKDGWDADDFWVKTIIYDEQKSVTIFLQELVNKISSILQNNQYKKNGLITGSENWRINAQHVAQAYVDNKLLKAALFQKCFYRHNKFYNWGINRYQQFIKYISDYNERNGNNDYLNYVLIFAKYEANLSSKINLYKFPYDRQELLEQCNILLQKYNENEQLHLLQGDILFELKDKYFEACNVYTDIEIKHCSYANFKCGKIFKSYYKDYKGAIILLERAIAKNKKYYQAWYQLGDCYEQLGNFQQAIDSFKNIFNILENKLKKHLLSPIELEYLYKAIMRIAIIYKVRKGSYSMAYAYNELADSIRKENAIENYVDLEWGDEDGIQNVAEEINEAIKKHVNIKLEEIY